MSQNTPTEIKVIASEHWEDWCVIFSIGNRGRNMCLSTVNDSDGIVLVVDDMPLVALDYDPPHKGNNLIISFGQETAPSSHVIDAPIGLWEAQASDGLVVSIEVEDSTSARTIITFT